MTNKIEFLDYMAAKAMHAIINDESLEMMETESSRDQVATMAYQMAFAMIKAHDAAIEILDREPKIKPKPTKSSILL